MSDVAKCAAKCLREASKYGQVCSLQPVVATMVLLLDGWRTSERLL